jgi:DNA-binding GntR family transcriptional regulator
MTPLTSSLIDSLSTALRDQIIRGDLRPGERLTEGRIAEQFAVARPTAKAGLDRLTNEGLLRRGPRKSAVVPRLSAEDVTDIYLSRRPVESFAVRALAESQQVPANADRSLAIMTVAAERQLHSEHTEADIAFHRALVNAVSSPRLQRMHETVMGEAQLCIAQVRRKAGVDLVALTQEHEAILSAIRAGDPDGAVQALEHDLERCRQALLADIPALEAEAEAGEPAAVPMMA